MREILFRGKTKQGEWVEGFYVCNRYSIGFAKEPAIYENHYIYTKRIDGEKWFKTIQVEVIPETVGQFTGLTDKNGKKIFEGDIVNITKSNWGDGHTRINMWEKNALITYVAYGWAIKHNKFITELHYYIQPNKSEEKYYFEVIGNIHDNKELLGE